jgi:hypothetical protein
VLPLAKRVRHIWLEPTQSTERVPDTWEFTLPAPVDARIELTSEMQGTLVLVNDDHQLTPIAQLPPARGWKGKLPAGRYRLEATCVRPNNQLPYEVAVWPEQLVAGLDRTVTAPVSVPVSVGRDGLVQLSSFGSADVRARLYDDQGHLIAGNDDGPDDWNFQIQARVRAGTYRLQVDPVGTAPAKVLVPRPTPTKQPNYYGDYGEEATPTASATPLSATCSVSMRAPDEVEQPALSLPASTEVSLSQAVQLHPLSLAENGGLLLVAAQSSEGVGLAVEAAEGNGWRAISSTVGRAARLEVAVRSEQAYRLRLWSADGRATAVQLRAVTINPPPVTERQLQGGVALVPVPALEPRTGVVAVQLDRPGVFRLKGAAGATRACSSSDAPCEVLPNDLVTANESVLWLVADLAKGAKQKAAATRVLLAPGTEESLQFEVATQRPVVCDVENQAGGPVLALATSMSGQPGVRLVERADAPSTRPGNQGIAVGTWSAAAVTLTTQQPAAVVWSASGTGEPIVIRLQQLNFAEPTAEPVAWGSRDMTVAGITARSLDLPPGPKRLRLSLQNATVAVLSEGDRVTSVHWRGNEPLEETIEGTADRLTVLHTRAAADSLHIDLLPIAAADIVPPLARSAPYVRADLRAGVQRLAVAAAQSEPERPRTLHVRTANPDGQAAPVLMGADGRITRAADLPVPGSGGTLLVSHGPGLVLAWIDQRGEEAQDLWGQAPLPTETRLGPPTVVTLSGIVQALQFHPSQPLMLHVRTSTPVVTLLKRGDAAPEVEVHPTGTVLDAYLADERTLLGLRAIGGSTLSGTAEVTTSPVTPIREGLGPEVLLAAGATRLFSFTVTQDGPVGIGVRANPDVVECTLLDRSGKRLGSGVVQMPTLKPGTYLLALHVPPEVGPVTARPALAGVELPSTGPPEDVVRSYMKAATAPPARIGEEE